MKLEYFARIELVAVDSADTDKTILVSTNGGSRNDDETVPATGVTFFPPHLSVGSSLNNSFGRGGDVYQIPGNIQVTVKNPDGFYDDFLPFGDTAQYWDQAIFQLFEGDATTDGAALTGMVTAFEGTIQPGTLVYSRGNEMISFTVSDLILADNQQVIDEVWEDHVSYESGGTEVVTATTSIPRIMGDFTTDTAKIPVELLGDTDDEAYIFAVCNHEIGSVVITNETAGGTVTPDATDFANGAFQIDTTTNGNFIIGETLSVQCVGYPTSLTDESHVRLAQFILTEFGTVPLSKIHNDLSQATDDTRGSWRALYEATGSATPDYPARIYTANTSLLAINLANIVMFEANAKLAVSEGDYRVYWELPLAASGAATIISDFEMPGTVNIASDPNQEFATVYKAHFNQNPFNAIFLGYENTDNTIDSGPIFDRRTQFTSKDASDVIREYSNLAVYDSVAVNVALQRRLLWAILIPQLAQIQLGAYDQTANPMALQLYNDFILDSTTYRTWGINRDVNNGSITLQGLVLDGLVTSGMWADASGNDANGNAVTGSIWANASGEDGSGNKVTSAWI